MRAYQGCDKRCRVGVQLEESLDSECLAKDGLSVCSNSKYIISCSKPKAEKQKTQSQTNYTQSLYIPIIMILWL